MDRGAGAGRRRAVSLAPGDGRRGGQIVRRRADVEELVLEPAGADGPGPAAVRRAQQFVVQAADGRGGPAGRQVREDRRLDDLDADEVVRRSAAGGREPAHAPVASHAHAAVAVRGRMRRDGERDRGAGTGVARGERAQREGGEGVAVDDEEAGAQQRQRLPGAAGRAQYGRLPRVAHAQPGALPVAHLARDRLGAVVQVEDGVGDALGRQPLEDPDHERPAGDRHGRLRADVGQRTQARAESGREHEGGGKRSGHRRRRYSKTISPGTRAGGSGPAIGVGRYSKTISPAGRPRSAQAASQTPR